MKADAPFATASHLPIRDLRRLADILRVATEKGWGHYVDRLRLKGYLPKETVQQAPAALGDARRLRAALEELGPTFVKFGQMLNMRRDPFPQDIISELRKLQNAVPPFPGEEARRIIEAQLGQPVADIVATFDESPRMAMFGFPDRLTKGMRQLQKGEAIARVRHGQLEGMEQHIDQVSNRLSVSLIIAAIVMWFHTTPHYQGIPIRGLFGHLLAGILGLWWRSCARGNYKNSAA